MKITFTVLFVSDQSTEEFFTICTSMKFQLLLNLVYLLFGENYISIVFVSDNLHFLVKVVIQLTMSDD